MATAAMATAAGAFLVLYVLLNRRLSAKSEEHNDDRSNGGASTSNRLIRRKISRRPAQAPATWFETMSTLSETLRFTYSETLGKWPLGDLAFGINYLIRRQGDIQVASVYAGGDSVQLKGPEIVAELKCLLRLLTFCMLFSKKPFPVFLESAGYSEDDVLLQKPKAGLLKPAFTIICDHSTKCLLLLIRGTHSIKDTLTAATGAVVPFHHSVLHDGGISNLILGYAHCGMVAAARWIAKLSTPCLIKALNEYPDYDIKIVGHSLGGGTAALLTYIFREQKELFSSTCVAFAPAACMTWELAESGKHFISTVINGSDLVPTFSAASVDELRSEVLQIQLPLCLSLYFIMSQVDCFNSKCLILLTCGQVTASSWLNDLRDQVERTRVLNVVYRSATAIGSRIPSIATTAKARVVGAGALLRPVSSGTQVLFTGLDCDGIVNKLNMLMWQIHPPSYRLIAQWQRVVMRRAQDVAQAVVRTRPTLSSWSCMGARRRNVVQSINPKEDDMVETSLITTPASEILVAEVASTETEIHDGSYNFPSEASGDDSDSEEEREQLLSADQEITASTMEAVTEGELWYQLEKELKKQEEAEAQVQAQEEEAAAAQEITEEAHLLADAVEKKKHISSSDMQENHQFYPPGRIMHMVCVPVSNDASSSDDDTLDERVGIYETPRHLYSKIRLTKMMINDHYMPMYKKTMERFINELENGETLTCDTKET
ncbi:Sn1-specific diacylglycerol lipase alpha [Bienertia sinuspersici]